jgi:hypothetical protein
MRGNQLPFYYDESDTAILAMEHWVGRATGCLPEPAARWFLLRIQALRHNLLTEQETKNLKEEAELWLAQDPAIKRRKPRIAMKQKNKEVRGEWWEQVATKIKERYARELAKIMDDNLRWLPIDPAINGTVLLDAWMQIRKKASRNATKKTINSNG